MLHAPMLALVFAFGHGIQPASPPAVVPAPPAASPATTPTKAPPKAPPDYLVLPLKGTFGEEILASGVRKALALAKERRIQHVIYVIDSGGGDVDAAKAILAAMQEFQSAFKYHVIIKQAFSASMWVLADCDYWYTTPTGTAGAAVCYSRDPQTKEISVDAKLNAALAAQLAGVAEAKGHSGDAIRAMVLMDASLYWNANPDKPELSATDTAGWQCVDSKATVLACSPRQLIDWGMAEPLATSDPADIGTKRGYPTWTSAGTMGIQVMRAAAADLANAKAELERAKADRETGFKEFSAAVAAYDLAKKAADRVNPDGLQLTYNYANGFLSSASARMWTVEVDKKIACLQDAVRAALAADRARLRIERAGVNIVERSQRIQSVAGLPKDKEDVKPLPAPELPTDVRHGAERCNDDIASWQRRRIRTTI